MWSKKIQNIYNQLLYLLTQFKNICVINLNNLSFQINKIIIGNNKLPSYINTTLKEVTAEELNDVTIISTSTFYDCIDLTNVVIPNSVTIIGDSAFRNCTSLTNIIIPNNVTVIENRAFVLCNNLTDIYIKSTTPPTLGNINAIPNSTTIHVPLGSGEVYKNATNWSNYADKIIEDIEI